VRLHAKNTCLPRFIEFMEIKLQIRFLTMKILINGPVTLQVHEDFIFLLKIWS
jgi:hypothetical protein